MTKNEWLSLWDTDSWEAETHGVSFVAHRAEQEFHVSCTAYTKDEVLSLEFWRRLADQLEELDDQAHKILHKELPDEDFSGLLLANVILDKGRSYGAFALGDDTGIPRLESSIC